MPRARAITPSASAIAAGSLVSNASVKQYAQCSAVVRYFAGSNGYVLTAIFLVLQLLVQLDSPRDVALLRPLVPAAQQHNDLLAVLRQIHAVAGTKVDAQFTHTSGDRLHV